MSAELVLHNVLAIPPQAVHRDKGRTFCKLQTRTGIEERDITIGAGNDELVHVVDGLSEGDRIVLKESSST